MRERDESENGHVSGGGWSLSDREGRKGTGQFRRREGPLTITFRV